jgi:polyhydroxyalkanoate synthesis repressor PhaR
MQKSPISAAVVTYTHIRRMYLGRSAQEVSTMARAEQTAGPNAEQEPVLITRYPNRRLYDRSQGRYVTLPEIAELVRYGRTVTVQDSKTGEDLTRSILTQIILEYHPERMELFPVSVLNSIIQANDTALRFLREYLQQPLAYLDLLQRPAAVNPLLPPMPWMKFFLPNPVSESPAPAAGPNLDALLHRIAELERRLEELPVAAEKLGQRRRHNSKRT